MRRPMAGDCGGQGLIGAMNGQFYKDHLIGSDIPRGPPEPPRGLSGGVYGWHATQVGLLDDGGKSVG